MASSITHQARDVNGAEVSITIERVEEFI